MDRVTQCRGFPGMQCSFLNRAHLFLHATIESVCLCNQSACNQSVCNPSYGIISLAELLDPKGISLSGNSQWQEVSPASLTPSPMTMQILEVTGDEVISPAMGCLPSMLVLPAINGVGASCHWKCQLRSPGLTYIM